jgi:outer membrane protein OmpA-like peptidoglycan-associated protein
MRLTPLELATLTLGLTAITASAQTLDTRWYQTIYVHHTLADDARKTKDDTLLGVSLGKAIHPDWNLELNFSGAGLDGKPGHVGHSLLQLGLDGLYFFDRKPSLSPYAVIGLGALRTKIPGEKEIGLMGNVGLGLFSALNDNFSLRADARYRLDDNSTNVLGKDRFGDWILSLGVTYAFGPKPAAPVKATTAQAAVAPTPKDSDADGVPDDKDRCPGTPAGARVDAQGCEPDSDGDGVVDRLDNCPNTPRGTKVDAKGCELDGDGDGIVDRLDRCPNTPAGARVDAQGCELDSDGDGVVDRLDRCPGTPAGRKVDAQGCEPDSDGDGVVDALDQCPNTPRGDKVDARGCTLTGALQLKGVHFDNDAAVIRADARPILDEAVATLRRYPQLRVEVAGHTDDRGSDDYNLDLSQRRAQAVADYFVQMGIDAARLVAKGYGESAPVADNTTAAGRADNRRVELRILP